MTEEQFNAELDKGYQSMLRGEAVPAKPLLKSRVPDNWLIRYIGFDKNLEVICK